MWQRSPSQAHLDRTIKRLVSVLPPAGQASRAGTHLASQPRPEQVAGLLRDEPGFVWLDGAEQRLFARPLAVFSVTGRRATVAGPGGCARFTAGGFTLLEAVLSAWEGTPAVLVAMLGYELAAELEDIHPLPPRDFRAPDLWLALYDSWLEWDGRSWRFAGTDVWRGTGGFPFPPERAEALLRSAGEAPPLGSGFRLAAGPVRSRPAPVAFEKAVARVVSRIHRGELFQANLCRRFEAPVEPAAVWPLYLQLRRVSPARYGAFLRLGSDRSVLCISPELFLEAGGGGVQSRPIKGTRPRGRDTEEDRALARELCHSEKDRAELAMIVDVVRNDLGRVCSTNSVRVLNHAGLECLPTVFHTSSTVAGHLGPDRNMADLLRAAFPPASVTGAPKIQAIRVAMREEARRRGPAMGALGFIALDGAMQLAVAIRTAIVAGRRAYYYAGAGITADSDPQAETRETAVKALAFFRALGFDSEEACR